MAKVKVGEKELEVDDGTELKDVIEELGIILGCADGNCGVCKSHVLSGKENLNEVNYKEEVFECDGDTRLACQCKINKGEVELKNFY